MGVVLGKKFIHTYVKMFIQNSYLNEDFSQLVDIINSFRMDAGIHCIITC
jgi:uncharacterized protein YabN with tetrapyrrole methylase and pyrophosphatase domain